MLSAAMVLSRPRSSVMGRAALFEALEARQFLSAPTLTPLAPQATMTRMVIPIQYHSEAPIDLSTIGDGDIGVTGPGGFAQLARLASPPIVLASGDVVASYYVTAPGGFWNWPAANGTYNVGIVANAVRNTSGEGNAGGGAGSWWMWFSTPQLTDTQNLVVTSAPDHRYTLDGWLFNFTLSYPDFVLPDDSLAMHVTGPNGFDQLTYARSTASEPYEGASTRWTVECNVDPPGGAWDFSDSGTYTVQVAPAEPDGSGGVRPGDVFSTQTFSLSFTAPRVEVLSTSVGVHDFTATLRYTAPPGATINAASITSGDIGFSTPSGDEILGQLSQPPTTHPDGTVTAIYRFPSPGIGGWNYHDNGTYYIVTRFGEVTDSAGRGVSVGLIGHQALLFDMPSVAALRTVTADSIAWDIEVSYNNVGGLIDTSRLGSSDILVYSLNAGSGQYVPTPGTAHVLSINNSPDNILTVRYRFTPPAGGVLHDASYHVLYGNAFLQGSTTGQLPQETASLDMHFGGAAVMGLSTLSRTSNAWDVELDYANPLHVISTGSLGTQNLLVNAPPGRTVRVSLISFATGADQILRVHYRILPSTNTGTLGHGLYSFVLRSNSVFANGIALPGQNITSVTI